MNYIVDYMQMFLGQGGYYVEAFVIAVFIILIFVNVRKRPRVSACLMMIPVILLTIQSICYDSYDLNFYILLLINIFLIISLIFILLDNILGMSIFLPVIAGSLIKGVYLVKNTLSWNNDILVFQMFYTFLFVFYLLASDKVLFYMGRKRKFKKRKR
ncbi:MAG: hypothetical protein Q8882_07210 [Bacillota bacterium]|nr:hypothetical protein [Bacillota bacterium]